MRIPEDTMTPKERMAAMVAGKRPDRVPCQPFLGQNTAFYFGHTSKEFNNSATVMTDVLVKAFRKFRPDGISVNPSLQGIPEALGCRLAFQKYGAPLVIEPGLKSYDEIADKAPVNPFTDGRLPHYLETVQAVHATIGHEVCVGFSSGGPFTAAALLTGTDRFFKDLIRKPEKIHQVLELTTQSVINLIDAVCGMGFGYTPAEPLASSSLIRRDYFRTFAMPYLKQITAHMEEKFGKKATIHICGHSKDIWTDIVECGFSGFSIDNCESIAEVCAAIGDKLTIVGNVPPVDALLNGSADTVRDASLQCLREGMNNPRGFVLASGCEIPVGTPEENILAMVETARVHGRYSQ